MLGTRAAAFAGKISNLRESLLRIQNNTMPQPTCIDLANMLKYFCQVFHDFRDFKDIENIPLYASEKKDRLQLIQTLPTFDYSGLYRTLAHLVDILPLIPQPSNGYEQLCNNLILLFKCLVPFLDQANMETMPYLVSTLFISYPQSMHKSILDTLCFNLLPFTIDQQQRTNARMMREKSTMINNNNNNKKKKNKSPGLSGDQSSGTRTQPFHCIVRIEDSSSELQPLAGGENVRREKCDSEDQGIDIEESNADNNDDLDLDEHSDENEYALLSVTSILMVSFHYMQELMHHSQLIECLMKLKSNVFEDLLYVIAYGTTRARCPAVELLFRYWPDICPSQCDRKNNQQLNGKLKHIAWAPTKCQNKNCNFAQLDDDEAVKMCLDFRLSIHLSGLPPPMLVCLDCVDSIYKQQLNGNQCGDDEKSTIDPLAIATTTNQAPAQKRPSADCIQAHIDLDSSNKFLDLLLPMERISKLCENKKCKSTQERQAIGTCFDIECANYNGKRPIRYCRTCFVSIHEPCEANNYDLTLQNHIRHSSLSLTIMDSEENVSNFVEAIISLLKEASPAEKPSKDSERYLRSLMGPMSQFSSENNRDMNTIATEEKQLISQYGIWLMSGLCKRVDLLSDELLGRLLGMLFQWFHFTACLPDDQAGSALEKLKGECIKGWIMEVKTKRLDVFISCLLPHPIDCSKIGGHWEVWPDNAHQIKEGFKRLLCLVPYDIITDDVWDEIMPYWMECFRHEVPENELSELKILLSKVFDPELSPLGFETKQMYNFISSRFEDVANSNQEQTLYWLQIITMLEIPIPINFLYQMLRTGVKSLAQIRANELAKLKMVTRLRELDKQSRKRRARATGESTTSCDDDDSTDLQRDNQSDDDDDDDVMMPSDSQQQSAQARELSRQERRANARAAFSAKLQQQATILNAQLGAGSLSASVSPSASGALGASSASQLTTGNISSSSSQQAAPAKSQTTGGLAQLAGSGDPATKSKKPATKPKLRLNLESVDKQQQQQQRQDQEDDELLAGGAAWLQRVDNNLVCYILMMDILLKQLDLQEISSHRGLDGREAQQAIELLNAIISTPWLGKHTCCDSLPYTNSSSPSTSQAPTSGGQQQQQQQDFNRLDAFYSNIHSFSHCAQGFEHEDSYETCVFCEIISTFFQLSMSLVEFFSPVIEVSICEVSQDAANGEFDGKPDYSRIGLDHLGPSPKPSHRVEFSFASGSNSTTNQQQRPTPPHHQQDPTSPFSPSYSGPILKPEVLESLPKELQLSYNLLVQFHQYQTPDIVSQLLQMIKLVSLHSQVLSKAAKENPQFISWCQHNMLVNKLWSLCQLESSEIARTCVPLLLHCITLPWGVRLFRDLVERDFNSDNWLSRFRAVERVVTIAYFCEPSTIKNSTLLQSTMASAFCYVVRCLDDIEAIVAQRALVSLEMMKTSSLKLLLWCLEVQFDYITIDRSIILRSVFQLYNHLRDRRFLTWEFFLNRFDTIFLEAQIYLQQTGEIPSFTMQDLKNTNTKSEIYQKKIARAREALQETHHSRSLSARFQEKAFTGGGASGSGEGDYKQSIKLQQRMEQSTEKQPTTTTTTTTNIPKSAPSKSEPHSPVRRVWQHGKSTSSRYQSVAYLTSRSLSKRKNSKFMSNLAMQSVPPLMASFPDKLHQHLPNSFVDDGSKLNEIAQENHVFGVVHRVCDEDRDTNHSLIFLLMQFFSKPDPSHPQSIKTLNRSHQIVLKHVNILMGYSVARKNFLISASNLRLLPVFNALLTSLPKVLDFNYTLGTILLDTCLPVLIYCPATDSVQFDAIRRPTYSLWLLNPLMRQSWLMAVMTFLYKYQFNQAHLKDQVNMLIWIIINTLESHLNTALAEVAVAMAAPPPPPPVIVSQSSSRGTNATAVAVADETPEVQIKEPGKTTGSESSPIKSESSPRRAAHESIEMHNVSKELTSASSPSAESKVGPSASSGSLKAHHQTTTEFNSTIVSTKPAIIKADTTDNLTSKSAKFFQQQQRTGTGTGSESNTKLSTGSTSGSTSISTGAPKSLAAEERLLPIGISGSGQRSRQSGAEVAQVERLLPIGYAPTIVQVPTVISRDTQTIEVGGVSFEPHVRSTTATKSAGSSAEQLQTERPLIGLKGGPGLLQSSATSVLEITATPKSPSSSSKSAGARKSAEDGGASPAVSDSVAPAQSSKAARLTGGRFGGGGGGTGSGGKHSASDTRLFQQQQQQQREDRKGKGAFLAGGKFQPRDYVPPKSQAGQAGGLVASFSSPSLLNEQLAQLNRHSCVQEFSDKDLSMCLVILETFIHHEPSMAAQMLPNILRIVARYSSASFESWQTGSNANLVGGSMFVARQFIRVALHDLMENNIFHQIFTSHFTGYEFYRSMSTALADFADLNQLAPLSKLFEDLNKQKNLPPVASLMTILENVATYFECITQDGPASHSQVTWNSFIINWENFLRKLILALPRYSGNWSLEQAARSNTTTTSASTTTATSASTPGPVAAAAAAAATSASSPAVPAISSAGPATGATTDGTPTSGANQSASASTSGNVDAAAAAAAASSVAAGEKPAAVAANQATPTTTTTTSTPASEQHGGGVTQAHTNSTPGRQNPSSCSMIMAPIMRIILSTSKVSHLASCKTIVDPYSKIISYTVLNSQFKYEHLLEINHNCCRLYTRDREKYLIQRTIAYELVQVLKFRFFILEENLLLLLLFVLQDVGGTLPTKVLRETLKIDRATLNQADAYMTNVSECLRQHMGDLLEFVTDVHAISRINDNLIGSRPSSINRDSFGGHVKAAISQYLALEISLSHSGDQRTISRYLPWLYNSPSLQQGPREFIDCVSHIRQLSWLILGSLQHSALVRDQADGSATSNSNQQQQQQSYGNNNVQCQPIPIEKNNNIAEHVQVILAGFAEQSKESVLHMSGLFHAFLLCQLWTMYCENICNQHAQHSEQYQYSQSTLDDFWAKITPGVLRLVGHSRVMSEMVSTHFLQLIESLIESNSSILIRYLPMWNSVFYSYKKRNKSSNLAIRLQKCIEWQPPDLNEPDIEQNKRRFINWLEKVQYKMSHIEIQSSQAAPFYLS